MVELTKSEHQQLKVLGVCMELCNCWVYTMNIVYLMY